MTSGGEVNSPYLARKGSQKWSSAEPPLRRGSFNSDWALLAFNFLLLLAIAWGVDKLDRWLEIQTHEPMPEVELKYRRPSSPCPKVLGVYVECMSRLYREDV